MPRFPSCLLGPQHVHPGVRTVEDYRRRQAVVMATGRAAYPNLDWPVPWVSADRPAVHVAGGMWQVRCTTPGCQDFPAASREWQTACCLNCGAIYERLVFPVDAAEIERVLVQRPHLHTRNWNWPEPGETVEDLRAQNREQGDPD